MHFATARQYFANTREYQSMLTACSFASMLWVSLVFGNCCRALDTVYSVVSVAISNSINNSSSSCYSNLGMQQVFVSPRIKKHNEFTLVLFLYVRRVQLASLIIIISLCHGQRRYICTQGALHLSPPVQARNQLASCLQLPIIVQYMIVYTLPSFSS